MKALKLAVIGGGSSYTPELVEGLIRNAGELPVKELVLVDIKEGEEKLNIIAGLAERMVKKAGVEIKIERTFERRSAVREADFVLTQFRVGGLEARAADESIPLNYDVIGQETTGPGGFAKALRTIPVVLDICRDMAELAPEAWLINFTNPAGLITEAVSRFARIKVIGLCNVPITMRKMVEKLLDVDGSRVKIDFIGLNHLVWGKKVYVDGEDMTLKVLEKMCDADSMTMKNIPDHKWDKTFLYGLGMLPCPYHRYYYMKDAMLKEMKEARETRAEAVKRIEKELFAVYRDTKLDVKPPQLEKRGGAYYSEAAISLIGAIYNDKREIHVVNTRNNGAVGNLPADAVIETNCVVDKTGAHPVVSGNLPLMVNGLVQTVKSYEALTVEAGRSGDYQTALKALVVNPFIPSVEVAKKLLDDILSQNKTYLPQFDHK